MSEEKSGEVKTTAADRAIERKRLAKIVLGWKTLLEGLGYDLSDIHLAESPERIARFMSEWHTNSGKAEPRLTTFANEEKYDELVLVKDISFYSLCAHHGLPFHGTAAVAYIPGDRLVGLSKFARVVDHFANRFQVQERLTAQVAEYLDSQLNAVGVAVVMRAEHLCTAMRGVKKPGHTTVTSCLRGAFRQAEPRAELMALMGLR